jgi:hypothetical protein
MANKHPRTFFAPPPPPPAPAPATTTTTASGVWRAQLYRPVHLRVTSHALAQRTYHFEGGGSAKCPCGNGECKGDETTAAYFLFGCPSTECLREAFYRADERILPFFSSSTWASFSSLVRCQAPNFPNPPKTFLVGMELPRVEVHGTPPTRQGRESMAFISAHEAAVSHCHRPPST